jgi:hypothetical protein
MNLTLQYRLGTSGAFTTVSSSTYTTSATAQAAAQTFTNIALPTACNNQAVLQLRWLYYESASQSGSRDAVRLDDIIVNSSSVAALPTKFAVTAITPTSPNAGSTFSVTVQSQDDNGNPADVELPTTFYLFSNGAEDELWNGEWFGFTIPANQHTVTVSGVLIEIPRNGVTLTASYAGSGDVLNDGTSAPFNVVGPATQLAFVGFPSTGNVGAAGVGSFTVQARHADNSVDTSYTGSIVLSKASGPAAGTVGGTTSVNAIAGVATFSSVTFSLAGTYTLNANSGSLSQDTSGNITISLTPIALGNYPFTGTASAAGPASRMVASGVADNMTMGSVTRTNLTVNAASGADDNVLSVMPTSGTFGTAINTANYIEFTPTPNTGHYIALSSLSLSTMRTSAGATNFAVRSSLDNFATNIGTGTTGTSYATSNITLTGNAPAVVTFRIYPYGGSSNGFWRIDDITLTGNVLCVTPSVFTIGGGGSYCTSGSGATITLSGSQVGINYQLKRNGFTEIASIAGTGSAISWPNQTAAGTYTVEAASTGACAGTTLMMTGNTSVSASPPPTAGSISGGGVTVCSGTNSTTLTLSGQVGTIQWQSSPNGSSFTDIPSATSTSYTATNLNAATYFRVVMSSDVCSAATTSNVIINVNPAAVAGSISGATSVCTGINSTVLTLSGSVGSIQWQSSSDGITFNNISGQTAATYTATNLTATTYYHAVVTSAPCASATTADFVITVNPTSVAGNISGGNVAVCTGTNNTVLTLSGHTGTIQWQSSPDNITFNNISGHTATTYTANNLTQTTYYRAVVTSSPCMSATTGSVSVIVNPASVAGNISGGGVTVCTGTNNTVLTLSGHTGTVQWQSSPNGATFTDISGETAATYTATNLTATTYYRAVLTSSPCSPATTLSVSVTVNPAAVAGNITPSGATVCSGSNNTVLTLNGSIGTIQWQSSPDNNTFNDISGETGTTYTAIDLSATTYYRAVVSSAPCSSATTASVTIAVGNTAVAGNINGGGIYCGGATVLTLSGYNGNIQWQSSSDNVAFNNIDGETDVTYNATVSGTAYYRVVVTNGTCTDTSASVTVSGGTTTVWDGTAWSNGDPDASTAVVFAGNYTATADLNACSITVNDGAVIIPSGIDVNLNGALTVNGGSFTLENNANLIQSSDAANTGNIIVKRNSSAIRRQDYTLWCSPVTGQNLLAFSPLTVVTPTSRFYQYNSSTNVYNSITSPGAQNFNDAQGYLIRVANNHPTFPWIWNGQFTGVPHNGNYNYTMFNGGEGLRFNLVGNPYPSPISMTAFAAANSGQITQTLYFWRETNNNTLNNAYCSWSPAGGPEGTFVSNNQEAVVDPQGVIRTGQGFFVEASASGSAVSFTNAMRLGNNANQFFRPASVAQSPADAQNHRIWLNVTNAGGAFCQTAFGYMQDATNGYDAGIEGKYINSGQTEFYSIVDGAKLVIQGRALPFVASDIVPMGFKATTAGSYSIAIDHVDGLFTTGQQIYIRDNLTGTQHLLNDGPYTFTAEAGESTTRFEVLYQAALGTVNPTLDNTVRVIKSNGAFTINSGNAMIDGVQVFDIRGRLLARLKDVNATQVSFTVNGANQVLIVKIKSVDGQQVTRKVIN